MDNLPQSLATSLPPQYCGNMSTFCKPSGIGLHLNSIVNAASMGHSSTAGIKLEDHFMGVQVKKSTSVRFHLKENTKSPLTSNVLEKSLDGDEERLYENKASIAANSAATESPNTVEFEHQVAPDEKGKLSLQKAESLEEYDQPSPKRKRLICCFIYKYIYKYK